jgi:hypothetical protein
VKQTRETWRDGTPSIMDHPNSAAGEGGSRRHAPDRSALAAGANVQEKTLSQRTVSVGTFLANELGNIYVDKRPNLSTGDNVFIDQGSSSTTPADPAGGTGTFPPAYGVIRAAKFKRLNVGKIGSTFGISRTTQVKIGYPRVGFKVEGDERAMVAQNYHCSQNSMNISLSISKPKGGGDDMACLACPVSHSLREKLDAGLPVVIVLTDQAFPAILPAENGDCAIILRVEDALLGELEGAFVDRFKGRLFPHGTLPPGSVILIGSISHLQARGVSDYAEELVAVTNGLVNKTGGKVEVIPLVNIPLAGLDNAAVVRSLLDLDGWLTTAANLGANSLPNTRTVFWDTILKEDCEWEGGSSDSFSFMLPVTARNPRKRPFLSERPVNPLPSKVGPISELGEKKIVTSLLSEVNSVCGLNLDINVSTERSVGSPARHDDCRYIVVGASHMCRVATALREDGANVSSLATPGWKPTSENLEAAANYCSNTSQR